MKESIKTVHEVSRLTGVSIRTLHYYDEIGLLSPAALTDAGYRLYDDADLRRLQSIMLFRELEFSLKDIKRIIDSPAFDQREAIDGQIRILELKRDHLEELIEFAKGLKEKGETAMNFNAFDKSRIEEYRKQAKAKWGDTKAYKEYEERSAQYTEKDEESYAEGLMDIFREFGTIKALSPQSEEAVRLVKKLQEYITRHYYGCTDAILAGLGAMYSAGGEMTDNIDAAGGKGCAEFVSKAIELYCQKCRD